MPNRADVARVERDLLERAGCLLGGAIGTFDDLFERIAARRSRRKARRARRAARPDRPPRRGQRPQERCRALRLGPVLGFRRLAARGARRARGRAARPDRPRRRPGRALRRLPRGARPRRALGSRPAAPECVRAASLAISPPGTASPCFAYGFEDLTAAEWSLLEALAGRAEVCVSLPYEPGRAAFASLARTAGDLAALAAGRVEELPPRSAEFAAPALAHLERALFEPGAEQQAIGSAVRFLAGAGARGTLELVGDELLGAIRDGTAARGDRRDRPVRRALSSAARDRIRQSRDPLRDRGDGPLPADPARARAALPASVRLGRRRPPRALQLPALAVLGDRPHRCRLRRGEAPRPGDRRSGPRRGGDRAPPRGAARRAARASGRAVAARRRQGTGRLDGAIRLRARGASDGRPGSARSALVRRGHPAARRARLARGGRWRARAGGAARGARTARCPGAAVRRARARSRSRPASGADTPLRHGLRARARGGQPPAARLAARRSSTTTGAGSSAPGSSGRIR